LLLYASSLMAWFDHLEIYRDQEEECMAPPRSLPPFTSLFTLTWSRLKPPCP